MIGKVCTFLAIKCLILSAFSGSAVSKSTLSWCKLSFSWPEKSAAKFLFASPPGPSPYLGIHEPNISFKKSRENRHCVEKDIVWIPRLIPQPLEAFQQIDEHSFYPFELFSVDFLLSSLLWKHLFWSYCFSFDCLLCIEPLFGDQRTTRFGF